MRVFGAKRNDTFAQNLVRLWPSVPYLGFGVWYAWATLTYSGTLWLSDTEMNGWNLSHLYIISTAAFAIVCLIAPFIATRIKHVLAKRYLVMLSALLAAVGSLCIILAGPYYLHVFFNNTDFLFWGGCALTGIGTALIGLKCGELYGELPPRRVLLYASLSQIVVAFIYFAVVCSPLWAPIAGGPSLMGMLMFIGLPVLAALIICMPRSEIPAESGLAQQQYGEKPRRLPRVFWRFVALSFMLPLVASMIRANVVNNHAPGTILNDNNILMLLRILMAIAFLIVAIRFKAEQMNFGKLYSLIAIFMVVTISCISVFGAFDTNWSILTYFASSVLDFVMWCLLAFVVFQKHISPIIVFGFGRGAFMLGCAIGWMLGVYILPSAVDYFSPLAFYAVCVGLVLGFSFVLFSERDYARLFSPIDESELSFESLMDVELREETREDKKGKFSQSIQCIAVEYNLSARETEVFRYLAMGHGSDYIADKLKVSWNTARSHVHNIYVKMGVHSRQELISVIDKMMETGEHPRNLQSHI